VRATGAKLGHGRDRPTTRGGEHGLAESDSELAKCRKANVEEPGRTLGDQALEVRTQEHAADEHVDGGKGIFLASCLDPVEEGLLRCGGRAEDDLERHQRRWS
jgi:hypothetical protein